MITNKLHFTLEITPIFKYENGRPYWFVGLCRQIMQENARTGSHNRCMFQGKTRDDVIQWFLREIGPKEEVKPVTMAQLATAEALATEPAGVESPYVLSFC